MQFVENPPNFLLDLINTVDCRMEQTDHWPLDEPVKMTLDQFGEVSFLVFENPWRVCYTFQTDWGQIQAFQYANYQIYLQGSDEALVGFRLKYL